MGVGVKDMVKELQSRVRQVSPRDVKESLERGEVDLLVDVRERGEYRKGHVPGAINVCRGLLELRADPATPFTDPALSANPGARIVVYCLQGPGFRSLSASDTLARMGFSSVSAMTAGMTGWSEAGFPIEADAE